MSLRRRNPTSDAGAGFKPARAFLDRASEELRHPIRVSPGAGFKPAVPQEPDIRCRGGFQTRPYIS